MFGDAICDLRVGTLDFPSLMEPDLHIFTDSKLDWVILPEGAKTKAKDYELKEWWPKSSLRRLDICLQKVEDAKKKNQVAAAEKGIKSEESQGAEVEESSGEGEKTPTAAEFGENDAETDEAFEKRYKETEKALQGRLEKLRLKLDEEELAKKMEETTIEAPPETSRA